MDFRIEKPGEDYPHPNTYSVEGKELIPGTMFVLLPDSSIDLHDYMIYFSFNYLGGTSHTPAKYFGYMALSLRLVDGGRRLLVKRRRTFVFSHKPFVLPDYLLRKRKDHVLWELERVEADRQREGKEPGNPRPAPRRGGVG